VQHAYHLLDLINSLYRLRTCKLALTDAAIAQGKFKPCLNIHIKKCYGPCVGEISAAEYNAQISGIKDILRGNTGDLIREYRKKMQEFAANLEFEQAQEYKEKMELLQNHYSKSLIVHPSITNTDVFSIVFEKGNAFGNFFRLNGGCIIQALNLHFKLNIEEEKEAVLTRFIQEIYQIVDVPSDTHKPVGKTIHRTEEILVPFLPDNLSLGRNIHVPLKGDKLNLLELSTKNAKAFMFQKMKQEEIKDPDEGKNRGVIALKEALQMDHLPLHIECFDNSNTQGTNPVAACVVFKNGRPSKRDYRHFNIKTVVGANDFASMQEVVYRRYSRLLEEGQPLPQLILIDGGKGQLHFAHNALMELGLHDKIKLISIAERMEELYVPGDSTPLFLDKTTLSLKLLMYLRDEAHRFGITHHRSKRTKGQTSSVLAEIDGVGEVTQQKLIRHYKSVKRIKESSFQELVSVVGKKTATAIFAYFGKEIE
jgi:excinuclease ABC subunit C